MLWIKSLHLVFVIAWYVGLLYLPRIFVNIALANEKNAHSIEPQAHLTGMARRLYRFMTFLAVGALVFGLWLWQGYGIGRGPGNAWMHAKLFCVFLLIGYHHVCKHFLVQCENKRLQRSARWLRYFNELPAVLLAIIVICVVVKPG